MLGLPLNSHPLLILYLLLMAVKSRQKERGRKTLEAGNSMWYHSKGWPLAELRLPWQEGENPLKHSDGQGAQG